MISTQRLILILVLSNMMIGIAMSIYDNPTGSTDDYTETEATMFEVDETRYESIDGIYGASKTTDARQFENTLGNSIKWSGNIISIFFRGLNPFSVRASMFENEVEKKIVNFLVLFRSLLYIIIMIEVFMLLKNKKNT